MDNIKGIAAAIFCVLANSFIHLAPGARAVGRMSPGAAGLLLVAAVIAIACTGSKDLVAPPGTAYIAGAWTFNATWSNSASSNSCEIQRASVSLTQRASSFTGLIVSGAEACTVSGSGQATTTSTDLHGASLDGGQITGSSLSFTSGRGACSWTGSTTGNPSNSMSGSVTCQLTYGGNTYPFAGLWSASK